MALLYFADSLSLGRIFWLLHFGITQPLHQNALDDAGQQYITVQDALQNKVSVQSIIAVLLVHGYWQALFDRSGGSS